MRKLATIRKVREICSIPGADNIELAKIDGWQCVVKKDEFKPGDLGVYFEIDSALPFTDSRYEFLVKNCRKCWKLGDKILKEVLRIKTIRLRGITSQGLFMPVSIFPEIENPVEGNDYTEILKIEHYDEVTELYSSISGTAKISGNAKGNFPSFIPKTDEERIQNLYNYFTDMKDVIYEETTKADGSSMTVYNTVEKRPDSPFGVCSRNLDLKEDIENIFWKVANSLFLRGKMQGKELALQGELVGPGVNGNQERLTDYEYRIFRVWDIQNQRWLSPEERYNLTFQFSLKHVEIKHKEIKVFTKFSNIEDLLKHVEGKTISGTEREGSVFKAVDGSHSFKVINNKYLLAEK